MLMEFAEENWNPAASKRAAKSAFPNMFLTFVCASSKFPSMATTEVLSPFCVTICFSWMALTPFLG